MKGLLILTYLYSILAYLAQIIQQLVNSGNLNLILLSIYLYAFLRQLKKSLSREWRLSYKQHQEFFSVNKTFFSVDSKYIYVLSPIGIKVRALAFARDLHKSPEQNLSCSSFQRSYLKSFIKCRISMLR